MPSKAELEHKIACLEYRLKELEFSASLQGCGGWESNNAKRKWHAENPKPTPPEKAPPKAAKAEPVAPEGLPQAPAPEPDQ